MEALIGVIIGGVIGYGAAITTLLVEHRRWKREFKLQYLITERIRREKQCDKIKEILDKDLSKDLYSVELSTAIWQRLPLKPRNLINKAWKDIEHSRPEGKAKLYREVSLILGDFLREIDKQIEELTQ